MLIFMFVFHVHLHPLSYFSLFLPHSPFPSLFLFPFPISHSLCPSVYLSCLNTQWGRGEGEKGEGGDLSHISFFHTKKQKEQNNDKEDIKKVMRIQREKNIEIEIKNETIERIRDELSYYKKLIADFQVQKSNATEKSGFLEEYNKSISNSNAHPYSPPPERLKSIITRFGTQKSNQQEEIDDLRSRIDLLKK